MTTFVDSAFAPTPAQVRQALGAGIDAWAFYLAGPGAYHNWTVAEVDALRQGGMTVGLPIFVPLMDLAGDPVADAAAFASAMEGAGVYGAGALDTEASMRGLPGLEHYVDAFTSALRSYGIVPVVYGGGNYVPAGVSAWWIEPGAAAATVPAGVAYQVGGTLVGGLQTDLDYAGVGFPFASLTPPTPTPAPSPYPVGGDVICVPIPGSITTNADGWMAIDLTLPVGKTKDDVVSVVMDCASGYDPQGWQWCEGSVDFTAQNDTPNVIRLVFRSAGPNQFFTGRVFVAG